MGRANAHKAVEFVFQTGKLGKCCTCYDTTERVANEGEPRELVTWAIFSHELQNFLAEPMAHLCDV